MLAVNSIRDFLHAGTRAFYRPVARVSFAEGVEMMAAAVAQARDLGLADIVLNTLGFSGFEPPTVVDRYHMALRMVESARGSLRVAYVIRPDLIDYQKIGTVMTQNRGLISGTFPSEAEALAWLDVRRKPASSDPRTPEGPAAGSDRAP